MPFIVLWAVPATFVIGGVAYLVHEVTRQPGGPPCRALPAYPTDVHMADQKSLRAIGFGFCGITALVVAVAVLVVTNAQRIGPEFAQAIASTTQ